jgi:hypothetical protein
VIILDGKDFSSDTRLQGLIVLALAVLLLFVLPLYLYYSPLEFLRLARPVVIFAGFGGFIVLLTLALFLQNRGMLFKVPLKFHDKAVQIQPIFSLGPKLVPYDEISEMEFWYGLSYRRASRGCYILSARYGSITSVETFPGKEKLKAFMAEVRPILEGKGMKMKNPQEDAGSLQVVFLRDVRKRQPA